MAEISTKKKLNNEQSWNIVNGALILLTKIYHNIPYYVYALHNWGHICLILVAVSIIPVSLTAIDGIGIHLFGNFTSIYYLLKAFDICHIFMFLKNTDVGLVEFLFI